MTNQNMIRLGETLRRHRIAARLSQEEMAKKAGMSQKKYSQIEQGNVQDPGLKDVVEIGRALGFTPNQVAEVAGLWFPTREADLLQDDRWDFVQTFVRRVDTATRDRFLDMAYAAALTAERLTGMVDGSNPTPAGTPRGRKGFAAAAPSVPYAPPIDSHRVR